MPPDPCTQRTPRTTTPGGSQIKTLAGGRIGFHVTSARQEGCGCGWCWCPYRLRRTHDLLLQPCVAHGMPASWEHMEALGLDPLTGEVAA